MEKRVIMMLVLGLVANLGLTGYLWSVRDKVDHLETEIVPAEREVIGEQGVALSELREELIVLREELLMRDPLVAVAKDDSGILGRLDEIEKALEKLKSAMDGVSLEAASAEREEIFRSEDGHLKAAEYFAAGKFEMAGLGFLTFLNAHPDYPEHRSLVEKARQAFAAAGNLDRAIAVQEELMEIYPEKRAGDLMTLAKLQQRSGKYEEAAMHAKESAGLINDSSKYWNLLYSAWYTQQGEGLEAGLAAHREVEAQIMAAGHGDEKLGERVREKIAEIEREKAAQGR